jgi:hypothetical protein
VLNNWRALRWYLLPRGCSDTSLTLTFDKKNTKRGYLLCLVFCHVAATSSPKTEGATAEGRLREEDPEGVAPLQIYTHANVCGNDGYCSTGARS